jgi:hypothetical protein
LAAFEPSPSAVSSSPVFSVFFSFLGYSFAFSSSGTASVITLPLVFFSFFFG